MRILFLSQGRSIESHPDFDASFRMAQTSDGTAIEFRNLPYIGYAEKYGWDSFYQEVLRQNEEFRPDAVFFHCFHSGGDLGIAHCCHELKMSAANKPVIVGSIGDPFYTGWRKYFARPLPRSIIDLAANADALFSTSMGNVADELVRHGARNMVFVPNAFLPCHFPYWEEDCLKHRDFGISMLCSNGRLIGKRIVSVVQGNWVRRYVAKKLTRHFGCDFTVFGRGWKSLASDAFVPFDDQVKVFRRSRVVVDAPAPILNTAYYSSNRAFFILGSGTPLVCFHTPRFEKILRPVEHAFYVHKIRDVISVCKAALAFSSSELEVRFNSIHKFVRERHLNCHRVDTYISTIEALQKCREGLLDRDEALRQVRMHHFLPEVDLEEEYRYCVANWVG